MDKQIEEQIKQDWLAWGEKKPWYCPKCDILISMEVFSGCGGGSHPYKPTFGYVPYHDWIEAKRSVTFEEFCSISYRWLNKND
jgi:hypothetical protein